MNYRNNRLIVLLFTVLLVLAMSAFRTVPVFADDGTPPPTQPQSPSQSQTSATDSPAASGSQSSSTDVSAADSTSAPDNNTTTTVDTSATSAPDNSTTSVVDTSATPAPGNSSSTVVDTSATSASDGSPTTVVVESATPAPDGSTSTSVGGNATPAVDPVTTEASPTDSAAALSQIPVGTNVVVLNAAGVSVPLASLQATQIIATGDPMWCPTGVNPGGVGCTAPTLKFNGVGGLLSLISGKTVPGTIWIETTYSSVGEGGPVTLDNTLTTTSNFALTVKGGWNGSLGGAAAITGTSTFNVPLTINWNADVTLNDIEISGIASAGTAALTITTPKNITLNRVHVHTNSGAGNRGARLDNTISSGTGNVSITSSEFAANNSDNLYVKSNGTITLTNVLAFGSVNGSGAILDNSLGTPKSVTLNGNNSNIFQPWLNGGVGVPVNSFDSNFNNGLQVLSKGPITISNLIANTNANGYGAQLNNTFSGTGSPQAVTLTGVNQFNTDHLNGLNVTSNGAVSLASITANSSVAGNGVYVDNRGNLVAPPDVNVTGNNQFNNNWFDGLEILTNGAISLNNVTATADGQSLSVSYGVYLDNCNFGAACANLTTKPVTLTGTNTLSANYTTGLLVNSKGVITISNLTANGNAHGYGVKLDNHFLGTGSPQAVTLTGVNQFNTNYYDGLNIVTNGAVSLASLTANNNGTVAAGASFGYGVSVNNTGNLITPPDVTVTGTNQFNTNWLTGLNIITNGAISLNNVTATANGQSLSVGYGVYLDNCNFSAACANLTTKPVTLTGTNNLSANYTTGLLVNSKGVIAISNLTANSNTHGYGAQLNNTFLGTASPQAVSLTGVNQFNTNHLIDLYIVSNGAVSLANVTANSSITGYGVYVDNRGNLVAPPDVNVTGTNQFNTNYFDGLNIFTYGAISLNNVTATNNGQGHFVNFDYGVNLDNCTPAGSTCTNTNAKAVTLTGINNLSNNYSTGLFVKSKGAITVDDLTATGNTNGYGAWLENDYTGSVGLITINGGLFYPNGLGPLHVLSNIADVYISAPMWCPVGVTPGAATCSHTIYPNLEALAADAGVGFTPNVPGVIWIQNSTFASTGSILFDGNAGWALWSANNLTFQGGWSGLGTTIISGTPSVLQDPLSIINWHANVTLNDIEITGVPSTTAALTITTNKNITLMRVHVHNNGVSNTKGASLNNTINSGTGNVTITSSEFDNNYSDNLYILSNGTITLTNVLALGSATGSGAVLDNHLASIPMSVTITGDNSYLTLAWINSGAGDFVNSFNNNFNDGLQVSSKGTITLTNITANHNGASHGAHSYGAEVTNDYSLATTGVTLTGLNIFNENYKDGLFITSRGPVTASNLTADSNGSSGSGVEIDNHNAVTAQPVTLTGTNEFKSNSDSGLSILSTGLITLNNIIADKNLGAGTPCPGNPSNPALSSCSGVYLYNSYPTYSSGVTITGSNEFNINNNYGLLIYSYGVVSLANITANSDGNGSGSGYAVYVDNSTAATPKAVTLSGTNSMDSNRKGLYISSLGPITANNVSVTQSTGSDGALLKNDNPGGVGGVTLTGINTFNGNYNGNGLIITSFGAISVSSVTAQSNGYSSILGAGINLDNHASTLAMAPGVTLSGTNLTNNNGEDGVFIQTKGLVTISNLTSNSNGFAVVIGHESGLKIDNTFGTAGVTLTGTNAFNSNYFNGIWVTSKGPITLSSVNATYNDHGNGADLVNTSGNPASPQNITITGTNNFGNNNSDGLVIQTYGVISLNNVTSDDSVNGSGALLDNSTGTLAKGVTLTGTNTFYYNHVDGIDITSLGQITASNLNTYNSYTGNGASLNNTLGTAGVTLSGANSFEYTLVGTGLLVQTHGAISISNVTADNNSNASGYYGLDLENYGSTPLPVTLTGTNEIDDNYNSGLFIQSIGLVTISNLTASHNGTGSGLHGYGLEISAFNTAGFNLTGTNYFYHDYSGGLLVYSSGPIMLNSVSATYSTMAGAVGASLNNLGSTSLSPQNVTFTGTNDFSYNDGDGLDIQTYGAISLNNVTSDHSVHGSGASLDNSTGTTAKTVTLTGTNEFDSNQINGLSILSRGLITASNLTASSNATGRGASFDNHLGTTGGVTLSGSLHFNNNLQDIGLDIVSPGAITISSITAYSNGNAAGEYGVSLDNSAGSAQPVTLTGTNDVESNYDSGLFIKSFGLITISNLYTSANGTGGTHGYGLEISNAAANTGVNLTGSNTFYNNYSGGLVVYSKGPISINNVSATGATTAGAIGAILNNIASGSTSPQNVNITGTNDFGNNDGDGLDIQTYGAISLNSVTSNYSVNGSGASLDNSTGSTAKTVTLTGTNEFYGNHVNGLFILSLGSITASNLTASSNATGRGASFDNSLGTTGGVTLTGINTFDDNPQDMGLYILSHGALSLSNVTANSNGNASGEYGASLNNSGVSAQPVTLTGTNDFFDNQDSGLYIKSTGLVTLNNLTSEYNGIGGTHGFGLEISNAAANTGVTLAGSNIFYNDYSGGLSVYSKGPITLTNVQATNSSTAGAIGALLDNTASGSGSPQNVTIAGTNDFSYNNGELLDIKTYGAISINNVTAGYSTTGSGASLDNSTGTAAKTVTLTGTNTFNSNHLDGLDIITLGGVTASSLTTAYNGQNGADLSAVGNVTFSGTNQFYGNAAGFGLSIHTSGAINLNNVTANSNGSYGADLDNTFAPTPQAVTLTGTNYFESNQTYGIYLRSNGAVTLASLTVQYNDQGNFAGVYGADIDNTNLSLIQPVSLTGTNLFYGNHDRGLVINTLGAIALNNISATGNTVQGAYLTNATAGQGVKLTGTNTFNSNGGLGGLYISTLGAITLNNLTASNNSTMGVQLDNSGAAALAVNITGTNTFSSNGGNGLSVVSKGAITLNNITASNNSGAGLSLNNSFGSAAVSLTGINTFLYNSGTGLSIASQGNVRLAKVRSDGNTNSGDGVNVATTGSVTFSCGSLTNNARYGLNISGASSVTLTGVVASGNTSADYHFTGIGSLTRVRTCP